MVQQSSSFSSPLWFGPFRLEHPLSQGGMGEVWKAVHRSGTPVAIKVLSPRFLDKPYYLERFRKEAQAMASLQHPGIVRLYEYGHIPEELHLSLPQTDEESTDHSLVAGTPYMVMEYLEEGTLHALHGQCEWPKAMSILSMLLEALAHAHARGILHRDLKPGNILLRQARTEAVLTDFGLATPISPEEDTEIEESLLGTPSSMAPEQVLKAWRDFGPWTDLYGLGCLTYLLLGNHPAYSANNLQEWLHAHCHENPVLLRNQVSVPEGLQEWLYRLLAKNPYERFQTAADALAALRKVDETPQVGPWEEGSEGEEDESKPTQTLRKDFVSFEDLPAQMFQGRASCPTIEFPEEWLEAKRKQCGEVPLSSPFPDVGLGLVELQSLPLVARFQEREQLWTALREVHEDSAFLLRMVEGPAGCGKTHLVKWLCECSQEAGIADVLVTTHDPLHGPQDGLAPMMARYFRCHGLGEEDTFQRLQARLGTSLSSPSLRALAAWMAAGAQEESSSGASLDHGFTSASDRYLTLERVLVYLARSRPLLLCFEDIQWGGDTLSFLDFLLRRKAKHRLPALLLLTHRPLDSRRAYQQHLQALLQRGQTSPLLIGPLEEREQRELLGRLLLLEESLQTQVLQRTEGNPLFAIQLLSDWAERSWLLPGEDGYTLHASGEEWLPDNLHTMWLSRLERALAGTDEEAIEKLEIAAALGQEVDGREWRLACTQAGLSPPRKLAYRLAKYQLALSREERLSQGWSFVHGMLRESLERQAREAGRWESHQRHCAMVLQKRRNKRYREREGRHWLEAGEYEKAFPLLLPAADWRCRQGEYPIAEEILDLCQQILDLHPDEYLRFQARLWVVRGRLRFDQGERQESVELGQKALDIVRCHGWDDLLGYALHLVGRSTNETAGVEALKKLQEAESLFLEQENYEELGYVRTTLGYNARFRGELEQSREYAQQALKNLKQAKKLYPTADTHKLLGSSYLEGGNAELAEKHFREALDLYQEFGNRLGVASCTNALGEIARKQKRWDEAEKMYQRSVELQEAIGAGNIVYPQVNLAQVWLQTGRFEEADALLQEILVESRRQGLSRLGIVVFAALLVTVAGRRQWQDWSGWFRELKKGLKLTCFVESDLAELLSLAGSIAHSSQQLLKARQAYKLALQQWEELSYQEEIESLHKALEEVEEALAG